MELREWRYVNPPAGNSSSYKKRFEKLIKYHIDHASSELESITKKDIKDDGFRLSEHYNNGHHEFDRDIIVSIDKNTDEFFISVFVDHKEVGSSQRKGYENFVKAIEPYMFLPDNGTQEYDDLLTESFKESIENIPKKLYHATYKPFLKSIQQKGLGNTKRKMWADSELGVVYLADDPWVAESYAEIAEWPEDQEDPDAYYDNIIILEVDTAKLDSNKLFIDENVLLDEGEKNSTWEYHGIIPWEACKIFEDSLTEWVAMKNSNTSQSASSSSSKTNKERFKELTDYMSIHKGSLAAKAEVVRLDGNGFTYKEHWKSSSSHQNYILTLLVGYDVNSNWEFELYMDTSLIKDSKGSGMESLLEELEKYFHVPKAGSNEHKSICESISSIANDFKLYENLWD